MRPLRTRLQEARKQLGIPWEDLSDVEPFLREKCAVRNVAFAGPEDFFQERMLAYVEKTWDQCSARWCPGYPPSTP